HRNQPSTRRLLPLSSGRKPGYAARAQKPLPCAQKPLPSRYGMVYTCFEMIRDCRADLPQGWRHFAASCVPVIRRILVRYTGSDALLNTTLVSLRQPQSSIFQSVDLSPERQFLAELRQAVLGRVAVAEPEIPLELASLAEALAPLTMVEKQA